MFFLKNYFCTSELLLYKSINNNINEETGFIIEYPSKFIGITILYKHDKIQIVYATYCTDKWETGVSFYSNISYLPLSLDELLCYIENFLVIFLNTILEYNCLNIHFKLDIDSNQQNTNLIPLFGTLSELNRFPNKLKRKLQDNNYFIGVRINLIRQTFRGECFNPIGSQKFVCRDKQFHSRLSLFKELPKKDSKT